MEKLKVVTLSIAALMASGCVTTSNQAKVSMLQPPEVSEASKVTSISVARFAGQGGDVVAVGLESAMMNARIRDKPVYRNVARANETRALGSDPRSLAAAARAQGTDALLTGEVVNANVADKHSTKQEYVCDQRENPKKFFSKCVSGHNETIRCIDRKASLQVQVKLISGQNGNIIYSEAVDKSADSSGCGNEVPTDGRQMLARLKDEVIDHVMKKIVPHDREVDVTLMDPDENIQARERFSGAIQFAHEGRLDRACDMFRDIYDAEKNSVAVNYNLGICEEANGAYWKANEYYRIADRLTKAPNKLVNTALERNGTNLKNAGALADNRKDLIDASRIESRPVQQTSYPAASAAAVKTLAPAALPVNQDALMLDRRVALVIGNAKYRKGALLNPVNDARLISAELRKANFQVIAVEDADMATMNRAIDEFGRAIKKDGVALVFYAGHGMQVKGENYLIPTDADLKGENDIAYKAVNLGYILAKLDDSKSRVNIVILDACRDNPFARSWRSGKGGLASIDAPSGTVIAFATAPGKTASDGEGANGLFTSQFAKQIRIPNQKIEDVLKGTRKAVATLSHNEQVPWDSSSLTGDFYFRVNAQAVQ